MFTICKSVNIYFCKRKLKKRCYDLFEGTLPLYIMVIPHTHNMSLVVRKPVFGVSKQVHTNRAVQPHKMVRGLKFRMKEVEGFFYLCSENKDADQLRGYREADLRLADQLRGYREADLRLCFRICKKPVFSQRGSYQYLQLYVTSYYSTVGMLYLQEENHIQLYYKVYYIWLFQCTKFLNLHATSQSLDGAVWPTCLHRVTPTTASASPVKYMITI